MEAAGGSQLTAWVSQGPRSGSRDGLKRRGREQVRWREGLQREATGDVLWAEPAEAVLEWEGRGGGGWGDWEMGEGSLR